MTDNWLETLSDRPAAMHVAWAGELVFAAATESDRAGRTVRFTIVRSTEEQGQAHPFSKHTLQRKGFAGTRFAMSLSPIDPGKEHLIEVLLLGWTDSPRGATVSFLLPPDGPVHPFLGCTRPAKGATATRWMACFVELSDDDLPVNQVQRAKVEKPKAKQRLSNVAALMIKNPVFWQFLTATTGFDADNKESADGALKAILGIDSKADLDATVSDTGTQKARFKALCDAFVDWQLKQGLDVTS